MGSRAISFGSGARRHVLRTLGDAARLLGPTLGPWGRPVWSQDLRDESPRLLSTGFEILRELRWADREADVVVRLLTDAAGRLRQTCGDGIASCVVLADRLYRSMLRRVEAGTDPVRLVRDGEGALARILKTLEASRRPVDSPLLLRQISACAAHDDPAVLALMEPVLDRLAAGAAAAVEESAQMESSASVVPGLRIPHGHLTRHVVNRPKTGEVMLEDARVLVFQSRVEDAAATARFLERAAAVGRPVLLFVSEMDADPLATVVLNHVRGTVHACPVRVSGEEIFEDLAAFSGATRIGPESGIRLDGVGTDQLGSVRRAVIDEDSTTLTEGRGNVRPRVDALRKRLQDPELSILDRESLQERAARLSGGLIQIFAGGPSGHEMRRRYSLIRAAIHAVRGGIQGGAVAGGGAALWSSGRGDPFPAFPEALSAPLSWIATNSGETPSSVLARLRGPRDGWDAVRGRVDDLAKAGILDPWFVVRDSLRTAWSLARTFLECDAIVAQKDPAPEPVLPDTLEEAERARRVLKNR